jgi:hypothetical protein
MLAFARRMNPHPHLTKASTTTTTTNTVGSNDEHIPSSINPEKMLLLNGNFSQEPTTPCDLITPNTCTKNSTFFYEIPTAMHSTNLSGKRSYFHVIHKVKKQKEEFFNYSNICIYKQFLVRPHHSG